MLPGCSGYVAGNAGPFVLKTQSRSLTKRHQFLLAENNFDDWCTIRVFSQVFCKPTRNAAVISDDELRRRHSMRRVEIQSIREVAMGSMARLSH
jgi:hypothetical protein